MAFSRYLFAVRWQREGWVQETQRLFLRRDAALRFADLLVDGRPDLMPVVSVRVLRRKLSDPETIMLVKES